LPVAIAEPLERVAYNAVDFPADYLRDMAPALIVAAGLARRDVAEAGRAA
jgi:Tfp pilus assembly PilM family ATPase